MNLVIGLDGCPGGWAAAFVTAATVRWIRFDGFGAGLRAALDAGAALVGVDVPVGLPATGETRACDRLARKLLGPRRASVFTAPWRGLLGHPTHAATVAAARDVTGAGVSIQAYGIYPRIAAVDRELVAADQGRLLEVHPEVAFLRLGGELDSKHTARGRTTREAVLAASLPPFDLSRLPAGIRRVDALDALACAWTARRWLAGTATLLPPVPPSDERGLFMGIAG